MQDPNYVAQTLNARIFQSQQKEQPIKLRHAGMASGLIHRYTERMRMNTGDAAAKLYVRYDGESLRTHEMDVKQLAPALMALGKAFDIMQSALEPDARVSLNVKATLEGSFAVDLLVHVVNEAESFLTDDAVTAVLNAAGLVSVYFSAINLLKHYSAKPRPTKIEHAGTDDSGLELVRIVFPDGSVYRSLKVATELVDNEKFRDAVKGVMAPTLEDGIDSVEFSAGDLSESVSSEEADEINRHVFSPADTTTSTVEMVIQALDVSFRDNGKWRITDGIKTQFVSLEDEQFKKRVMDGSEALRSNDIYRVVMRVERSLDNSRRLTTRYMSIVKVLDHSPAIEQPTLF